MTRGKLEIDYDLAQVTRRMGDSVETAAFASARGFALLAEAWLRLGWDAKYVYSFSWFGRPVIQLPDDLVRIQEVIYALRPDLIIETGVAHGGSIVFYASLLKAMGRGKVIGIDVEIRPHNRAALEQHELREYFDLIEGSSIDGDVVRRVAARARDARCVLVVLDSNHSYDHVAAELEAYAPMVSIGSYIVVTDGIMKDLEGAPRSAPGWVRDNPFYAAQDFLTRHSEFMEETPKWPFDETVGLEGNVSYWPGAWLKKIR